MPIYEFTVTQTVVVEAEDEDHAYDVCRDSITELDWQEYDVQCNGTVNRLSQLRDGWTGLALPYGGDGNTRLDSLLPE